MKSTPLLTALALAVLAAACAPTYQLTPPTSFKRYADTSDLRLITADGVMVSAREVENYPEAGLGFWTDAMKRHLTERGYAFKSEGCFETRAGLSGCTLDFLVPYGAEDWVLSETVFVVGERIVLVEAAGPYDLYSPVEAELREALKTFDPGS